MTLSVIILRSQVMPAWELGGLLGSYLWGAWLVVLGVLVFKRVNGGVR